MHHPLMARFRKKSFEVEAVQWDGSAESAEHIAALSGGIYRVQKDDAGNFECLFWLAPDGRSVPRQVYPTEWLVDGPYGRFPLAHDVFIDGYAPVGPIEVEDLARHFYEVYVASADGVNYQGLPCPAWDALPEKIRRHWCAVATASRQ